MSSSKCPTKLLIKKWNVVLIGSCACLYSLSQYKRILACLVSARYGIGPVVLVVLGFGHTLILKVNSINK